MSETNNLIPSSTVECPRCGGSGELRWNPSRHVPPDPQREESQTCPVCNGYGAVDSRDTSATAWAIGAEAMLARRDRERGR